jgi:hypothetical protein
MIGRRSIIGLSLLSALFFCAFAAQSASAASATNTTAFTCVAGGGSLDFSDAHCDTKVTPGTGAYGHVVLTETETAITVTNLKTKNNTTEHTTAVLKGEAFGVKLEITCTDVHGTGKIHNYEPTAGKHNITGNITTFFTNCTVHKPSKCAINKVEVKSNFEGVEGLEGKGEMGVEFKPTAGTTFVTITLENKGAEKCALAGKGFEVQGTAIATGTPGPAEKHSGATSIFTNAMTSKTLSIGGKAAEFEASTTVKMEKVGGVDQDPIALTTVT